MSALIIGLFLFLGVHAVSMVNSSWRDAMVARIGLIPWQGIYSLLAFAGLGLIVWGYGIARADPVLLYHPPSWLRHLAMLLLLPVMPLMFATYLPGRIQSRARHPMLLATKLWALAHLLANGGLADVLLFGSFLAWAVADRISFRHRASRPPPQAPTGVLNDAIAVVGGLAAYAGLVLGGHRWLIGVSPLG